MRAEDFRSKKMQGSEGLGGKKSNIELRQKMETIIGKGVTCSNSG